MNISKSIGGLAGAMAMSCLLGLAPQQADASVVLTGCAGGSFGSACSLAELVSGGSLLINETRFSNFGLDLFGGRALNAALIRVDPIDSHFNPGFTLVDTGNALRFASGAETFTNFNFDVNVISGPLRVRGSGLATAVGSITGPATGLSSTDVFEGVFDPTLTSTFAALTTFCNQAITPSCANSTVGDAAGFSRVSALSVSGFIDVVADPAGVAQINSVTMQFSEIPEPASLALLTLGLAGIRVSRSRRRSESFERFIGHVSSRMA